MKSVFAFVLSFGFFVGIGHNLSSVVAQDAEGVSFEEKILATVPPDLRLVVLAFSPLGKSVAYAAQKCGKCFIVAGDKKSEEFDDCRFLVFSPDGKTVVFAAKKCDKWFMVIGDKKGEEFDEVYFPTFSAKGKTVVYKAKNRNKFLVVLGDKKGV